MESPNFIEAKPITRKELEDIIVDLFVSAKVSNNISETSNLRQDVNLLHFKMIFIH